MAERNSEPNIVRTASGASEKIELQQKTLSELREAMEEASTLTIEVGAKIMDERGNPTEVKEGGNYAGKEFRIKPNEPSVIVGGVIYVWVYDKNSGRKIGAVGVGHLDIKTKAKPKPLQSESIRPRVDLSISQQEGKLEEMRVIGEEGIFVIEAGGHIMDERGNPTEVKEGDNYAGKEVYIKPSEPSVIVGGTIYVWIYDKDAGNKVGAIGVAHLRIKSQEERILTPQVSAPEPREETPKEDPVKVPDPQPPVITQPEPKKPRVRQPNDSLEGISESFIRSFKSNYIVPLDFGILLKGVGPVKLREIAKSGMGNFLLVHNGTPREITWNGSDFVYEGTQERALIYNGDRVYESPKKYEAAQNRMQQMTVRNEEEKYKEYPLNGLIYMPTLQVNGVTVMRFQPGTRTKYINESIYHSLKALAVEFQQKTKKPLVVSSVYRTHSHQKELRALYGSKRAATPGNSKHNVGIAVDIARESRSYFKNSSAFDSFAAQFGFDRPTWEDWHFEHIQSKAVRSASGIARPKISIMLDEIGRQEKREQFITYSINPTLQQAILDGMSADSTSYRHLYHNLYKLLNEPENLQLSVDDFDVLCTKERMRQHELDGRSVIPRTISRVLSPPQKTLAFNVSEIPKDKKERMFISDNYAFIKDKVKDTEYLRDFVGTGHDVLQVIDRNGQLFDLRWNQETQTYEHNGKHFPIVGGETILLNPIDPSSFPEFKFYERMPVGTFLRENPQWFEYQVNRLNEKWKEWHREAPLLMRSRSFRPLTIHDIYGVIHCESAGDGKLKHKGGLHKPHGEEGMLPLPEILGTAWLKGVDGRAPEFDDETPDVRENILAFMDYILAIKNKPEYKTTYHETIREMKGDIYREARYVAAVAHGRGSRGVENEHGNHDKIIDAIRGSSGPTGTIGYPYGSRQKHMNQGLTIADEVMHILGVEPEGGHAPHEEDRRSTLTQYTEEPAPSPTPRAASVAPSVDSPMTSAEYGERAGDGTYELPYRFVAVESDQSITPQLYNGGAPGYEDSSSRFDKDMAVAQLTNLAERGITHHINLLPENAERHPEGDWIRDAYEKAKEQWESAGKGVFPLAYHNLFMSDYSKKGPPGNTVERRGQRKTAFELTKILLSGERAYINCRNGMHRAPSATVLALVATGQANSWEEAIKKAHLSERDFRGNTSGRGYWLKAMPELTKLIITETLKARRAFESHYGNFDLVWSSPSHREAYIGMLEDVYNGRAIETQRQVVSLPRLSLKPNTWTQVKDCPSEVLLKDVCP